MDKKYVIGATVAVGALLLVPGLAAALARAGKPLSRATIKTGAVAWDEFHKAGAEAFEHVEDFVAEFQAELAARQAAEAETEAGAEPEPKADAS